MLTSRYVVFVLLFCILAGTGCEKKLSEPPPPTPDRTRAFTIEISPLPAIRTFHNILSYTRPMTITVTDNRGVACPGEPVDISLTSNDSVSVTVSYERGDTTDANGQLRATLTVVCHTSAIYSLVVEVRLRNNPAIFANAQVLVIPMDNQIGLFNLSFTNAKSTLVFRPGGHDSTQIVAQIQDSNGGAISGVTIDFQLIHTDTSTSTIPYVALSAISATTDINGNASIWVWNNPNASISHLVSDSISATIRGMLAGALHRTAGIRVNVMPLDIPAYLILHWLNPADTVASAEAGNVLERQFIVGCENALHIPIPNVSINLQSSGIGSIPYVTNLGAAGIDTITWSSDGTSPGRASIYATIAVPESPSLTDTISFNVLFVPTYHLSLLIRTSHPYNNGFWSDVTPGDTLEFDYKVRDWLNNAIPNLGFLFTTTIGIVNPMSITDASGTARAYLRYDADTLASGIFSTFCPQLNLADSIRLTIRPAGPAPVRKRQ